MREAIPAWLADRIDEGATIFHMPDAYPADAQAVIAGCIAAHEAALIPATEAELRHELTILSTGTIPLKQSDAESRMAFELLVRCLRDVPVDVLQQAIVDYMNAAGRRYFPRSAGELRAFTNPIQFNRQRRLDRLRRMARDAAEKAERAAKLEAEERSWTAGDVAAANLSFERVGVKTRYRLLEGGRVERYEVASNEKARR